MAALPSEQETSLAANLARCSLPHEADPFVAVPELEEDEKDDASRLAALGGHARGSSRRAARAAPAALVRTLRPQHSMNAPTPRPHDTTSASMPA